MSLNGSNRQPVPYVVWGVTMDDTGLEDTPILTTVMVEQECPRCGRLVKTERREGSGENAAVSFSRAVDKLQSLLLEHLEEAHE